MSREHAYYRENLEQVLEFTGGKHMLNLKQLKDFTGIKDTRTVKKRFPLTNNAISAASVGYWSMVCVPTLTPSFCSMVLSVFFPPPATRAVCSDKDI